MNKYAQVTHSLYHLILEESASKKSKAIEWDGEYEDTFQKLKKNCTSTPILAYATFMKQFELHTNVCILGLLAILYQN